MKRLCCEFTFILVLLQLLSCKKDRKEPPEEPAPQTTPAGSLPVLGLSSAISINDSTAVFTGSIVSEGTGAVTESGFCWDESATPTTQDDRSTAYVSTGSFTVTLRGLRPSTTYHARAFATNSVGASYSNEIIFKTFASWEKFDFSQPVNLLYASGSTLLANNPNMMKSVDNGEHWTDIHPLWSVYSALMIGSSIFAGTSRYLLRSDNGGSTWTILDSTIYNSNSYGEIIALANDGSNLLYSARTAFGGQVRGSKDNGKSWYPAVSGLPAGTPMRSFAFKNNTVFSTPEDNSALVKSSDNGETWEVVKTGTGEDALKGYFNKRVLVSGSNILIYGFKDTFLSTDNGITWKKLEGIVIDAGLHPCGVAKGNDVYLSGSGVVYISKDNGATFISSVYNPSVGSGWNSSVAVSDKYLLIALHGTLYRRPL